MKATSHIEKTLADLLALFQASPDVIPDIIARFNMNLGLVLQDPQTGNSCRVWHDPKEGRIRTKMVCDGSEVVFCSSPVVFCPKCSAVLKPWNGRVEQVCPLCNCTVVMVETGS